MPATSAPTRSPTARPTARATGPAATVTIEVTRAPACDDVARRTAVGTAVSVPLTCTDPDGDALTLSIVGGPANGSLGAIAGGAVTYTPDAGDFGADSFTYRGERRNGGFRARPRSRSRSRGAPSCDDVSRRTAVGTRSRCR